MLFRSTFETIVKRSVVLIPSGKKTVFSTVNSKVLLPSYIFILRYLMFFSHISKYHCLFLNIFFILGYNLF